jgi:hypothetical protein
VLEGYAVLPADSFAPGPASGQFIEAQVGIDLPFAGQPVQGVSGLAASPEGSWYVVLDNGFGTRANSADFLLRIYTLTPQWRTAKGGAGTVDTGFFISLSGPQGQSLTGADYDPESLVRLDDGSFWLGDEFGPYLLHFSAQGELLEPPLRVAGAVAPEYASDELPATLRSSRGFENLGSSPDGALLYPMLEGSLPGEDRVLGIYTFNIAARAFVMADGKPARHLYRLDELGTAVGALRMLDDHRALVVERDSGQGAAAQFKKVFAIDFEQADADGLLVKHEVADLLDTADPDDLDGDGKLTFRFDHQTIESIAVLDDGRLLIVNDNNYPFGRARSATEPDPTEFILIRPASVPGEAQSLPRAYNAAHHKLWGESQ